MSCMNEWSGVVNKWRQSFVVEMKHILFGFQFSSNPKSSFLNQLPCNDCRKKASLGREQHFHD